MSEDSPGSSSYTRFTHWLSRAHFVPSHWHLRIHDPARPSASHPDPPSQHHDTSPSFTLNDNDDTAERGICATSDLVLDRPDPLVSLPSSLLITPERAASSSSILALLPRESLALLSSEQVLALFLVLHRRLGERSPAFPYLGLLPSSFSTVEWWSEDEVRLLRPEQRQKRDASHADSNAADTETTTCEEDDPLRYRQERVTRIRGEWQQLNRLLSTQHPQLCGCRYDPAPAACGGIELPLSLRDTRQPPAEHPLCSASLPPLACFRCLVSLAEYQWAYSAVATRSCYWPGPPISCCLIPFLDMLNHSSFVTSTCAFDQSTRLYHLTVRDRHPPTLSGIVHRPKVSAGDEVLISYGELSNWQLLTRYGFVLADSQDERATLTVDDIEAFIARHCTGNRRRGPLRFSTSALVASPTSTAPLPAPLQPSLIRCCCTRALLPRSLTSLPRSSALLPPLPTLPSWSKHHAALLAALGMYQIPRSFQVPCCHSHWPLLTYIKVRIAFIGTDGCDSVTGVELQRMAAALQKEDDEERAVHAGWLDDEHQRRGRGLLIALARWMEGRLSVECSLEDEVKEVEQLSKQKATWDTSAAAEGGVSWLSRVLSAQFRLSRRRMLLGFIHQHQQ